MAVKRPNGSPTWRPHFFTLDSRLRLFKPFFRSRRLVQMSGSQIYNRRLQITKGPSGSARHHGQIRGPHLHWTLHTWTLMPWLVSEICKDQYMAHKPSCLQDDFSQWNASCGSFALTSHENIHIQAGTQQINCIFVECWFLFQSAKATPTLHPKAARHRARQGHSTKSPHNLASDRIRKLRVSQSVLVATKRKVSQSFTFKKVTILSNKF